MREPKAEPPLGVGMEAGISGGMVGLIGVTAGVVVSVAGIDRSGMKLSAMGAGVVAEGISSGVSSKVGGVEGELVEAGSRFSVAGVVSEAAGVPGSVGGVVEVLDGAGNWPRSSFDMVHSVWQKSLGVSTRRVW